MHHNSFNSHPPGTITRAVNAIANGAIPTDAEPAVRQIYDELRAHAAARLEREVNATLQPTDLVGEAFIKLFKPGQTVWQNRRHFFGSAARAMQQVLIDHWRKSQPESDPGLDFLADPEHIPNPVNLAEAIELLAAADQSLAEIVRLRVFAGLSVSQTAEALDLSERTVKRRFNFAKLWIYRRLYGEDHPDSP